MYIYFSIIFNDAPVRGFFRFLCVDGLNIVSLVTPLPGYFPDPQLLHLQFSLHNRKKVWQIRLRKLMSRKFEHVRSGDIKNQMSLPYGAPGLILPAIIGHPCAHTT